MEITLEKIELVKDRTGVSYKEAKEALEFAGGNVVDAIIYIEENIDNDYSAKEKKTVDKVVNTVKETVRKGNVTKIRIYHGDDVVLNLPVTIGAAGAILFPWGAVASAVAAAVTKCRVELVKEDGTVVDVSEKAGNVYDTVIDKGAVVIDEVRDKSSEIYASAKEKGSAFYDNAKEVGAGIYVTAKEKGGELYAAAKDKGGELYAAAKDKGGELYAAAKDKAEDLGSRFAKKADAAEDAVEDAAEELKEAAEEFVKEIKDAVEE